MDASHRPFRVSNRSKPRYTKTEDGRPFPRLEPITGTDEEPPDLHHPSGEIAHLTVDAILRRVMTQAWWLAHLTPMQMY